MSGAVVIRRNTQGGPECGRETRGYEGSRPQRASGMAHSITSVRPLGRDAIQIESALVAAGRSGNQMNLTEAKRITPAALNLCRPYGASGSPIPCSRIHRSPKPMRGFVQSLRLSPVGCLFHEQHSIMEGVGNVREVIGEVKDE